MNEKVKDLQMKRYRHIVQVILGEMKGAGVKSGVRCVWDSDTDGYASDIFMNVINLKLLLIIHFQTISVLGYYILCYNSFCCIFILIT